MTNPKESNDPNPTPNSNTDSNTNSLLPDGIMLEVILTDNTGKRVKNQTLVPDVLITQSNIEPPVLVMEALRNLSAELINHVFPRDTNAIRPVHLNPFNENGALN